MTKNFLLNNIPILTYEQQQQAVERIQTLRVSGMSTDEAIVQVARELRANHPGERIIMRWNLEEDSDDSL